MDISIKKRTLEFINYLKISIKQFENQCGLSNGYVNSMRKGFGWQKLEQVLTAYPELNRDWLLYGEGSMLRSTTSIGDISHSNVAAGDGSSVNVTATTTLDKAIDEISEMRKLVQKRDEQIDKLLDLLAEKK